MPDDDIEVLRQRIRDFEMGMMRLADTERIMGMLYHVAFGISTEQEKIEAAQAYHHYARDFIGG